MGYREEEGMGMRQAFIGEQKKTLTIVKDSIREIVLTELVTCRFRVSPRYPENLAFTANGGIPAVGVKRLPSGHIL